jgi:hypothetical protein
MKDEGRITGTSLACSSPSPVPLSQSTFYPRTTQRQPKKRPADLQALTTIQQNNFTPKTPPVRNPLTLTLCVTPHPSTTSRQHYFHRTAPLYMKRRIYFRSPLRGG